MAGNSATERSKAAIAKAKALVAQALDLLDANGGPPEAAAHLELGLQELRKAGH